MPEAEQGLNVARIASLRAGVPVSASAVTINRFCSSGLQSIASAAERIIAGFDSTVIAGGTESMSLVPMGGNKIAPNPALVDSYPDVYLSTGLVAENHAREASVSRDEQDAFALRSHQRAIAAIDSGRFADEIVPLPELKIDEGPRRDTSLEALSKLRPAFHIKGTVTAGNSSQTSDGAAAVLIMGIEARARVRQASTDPIRVFNEYLYDEQGFVGNRDRYDDPRNSFINEVLDRRTGIPISLAVIYLEIARRADLHVDGVNFPGHFLLRARDSYGDTRADVAIIDPFHGGARLSEYDCRQLLRQHVGDEAAFDTSLLAPATRHDIIVRILVNLKRLYVRMRSFPQARFVSTLLLGIDPSAISELRDRGLLAYHLQDFAAALRDLEEYLRLAPKITEPGEHADLRHRNRRYDGLGAFTGEPAEQSVDFERRPRPNALER